jgi:hypothetical protein
MSSFLLAALIVFAFPNSSFFIDGNTTFVDDVPQIDIERDSVERTVVTYCELAKKEDTNGVKKLIAYTPSQYWEYRLQQIRTKRGARDDQNNNLVSSGARETSPSSNADLDELNYRDMIESGLLAFRGLKIPAKEIQGIWIKDIFARMRVTFERERGLRPLITRDFFLVKVGEDWKIFKITLGSESETYPL